MAMLLARFCMLVILTTVAINGHVTPLSSNDYQSQKKSTQNDFGVAGVGCLIGAFLWNRSARAKQETKSFLAHWFFVSFVVLIFLPISLTDHREYHAYNSIPVRAVMGWVIMYLIYRRYIDGAREQ